MSSERSLARERSSCSGRCCLNFGRPCYYLVASEPVSASLRYWPGGWEDFPLAAAFLPAWPAVSRPVRELADFPAVLLTVPQAWPAASRAVFPGLAESLAMQPAQGGHVRK